MPLSNSDDAGILRFVHPRIDTFIRQLTFEDDQTPTRAPIDLSGYEAIFEITPVAPCKLTSLFKITTSGNPANISISGADHNLINLHFSIIKIPVGRYNYTLSLIDPSQVTKTWLKGEFIIT